MGTRRGAMWVAIALAAGCGSDGNGAPAPPLELVTAGSWQQVVRDGDHLYFLSGTAGFPRQIFSVATAGGDASVVFDEATGSYYIGAFTVKDGAIYMCRSYGAGTPEIRVERFAVGDTTTQVLATLPAGANHCYAIALDATRVFVTSDLPAPNIQVVPIAGGTPTGFAEDDRTSSHELAVDGDYLYFTRDQSFARMPLAGGAFAGIGSATPDLGLPTLSASGGLVALIGGGDRVDLIAGDTGTTEGHYDNQNNAFTIVTDGTMTYWGRPRITMTGLRWPQQAGQLWVSAASSPPHQTRADLQTPAYFVLDADYLYLVDSPGSQPIGIYRMKR